GNTGFRVLRVALVDGERVKDGQLCCTDDNMIDEAIRNLRIFMEKEPDARYWSISQNDTTRNCQCPRCKALDDKAGSPIGSIMYFVNRVAEAFPDKVISTLSYWYSRTAPKELFMRDNVHIMFCNIECNRSKPIQYDPASESFMQDMAVWHKYCKNIFLWDYNIQFKNLIAPFPNLRVLAPNMRCFYEGGVRSVFNQANRENRGEFWALRGYLLAKLSWNPYCDTEALTNRFLAAYYGAAAPYIRAYIDALHDALEASGEGLSIFGEPQDEQFLAPEKLDCYESILDCAKAGVAGGATLAVRVDEVRLGVVYARLKRRAWKDGDDRAALITFFADTAGKIGLEKVEEWKITTEMFIEDLDTPNA
ncbi:MAG: DUF4838 domain-containing protein, partial [Clostridia bacterium]|nr:DUF4838 domain-containing protein [Clostridia bacterium]